MLLKRSEKAERFLFILRYEKIFHIFLKLSTKEYFKALILYFDEN
jgi:hypothetical protein